MAKRSVMLKSQGPCPWVMICAMDNHIYLGVLIMLGITKYIEISPSPSDYSYRVIDIKPYRGFRSYRVINNFIWRIYLYAFKDIYFDHWVVALYDRDPPEIKPLHIGSGAKSTCTDTALDVSHVASHLSIKSWCQTQHQTNAHRVWHQWDKLQSDAEIKNVKSLKISRCDIGRGDWCSTGCNNTPRATTDATPVTCLGVSRGLIHQSDGDAMWIW